jgi:hypothetical protein
MSRGADSRMQAADSRQQTADSRNELVEVCSVQLEKFHFRFPSNKIHI